MTHTDYTKKILRIEDKNIYFNEDVNFHLNVRFNKITELSLIIV